MVHCSTALALDCFALINRSTSDAAPVSLDFCVPVILACYLLSFAYTCMFGIDIV